MRQIGNYFLESLGLVWTDKATLLARVLLPLGLLLASLYIGIAISMKKAPKTESRIAIVYNGPETDLVKTLSNLPNTSLVQTVDRQQLKDRIADGDLEAGLVIPDNFNNTLAENRSVSMQLYYNSETSRGIEKTITKKIERFEKQELKIRLKNLEIIQQHIDPIAIDEYDSYNKMEKIPTMVSALAPFLVLLFSFLACISPALLITRPTKTVAFSSSKFLGHTLAVMFVGFLVGTMTMFGIYGVIKYHPDLNPMIKNLITVLFKWKTAGWMLMSLLPFLFFVGTWLTYIGLSARTFKRAQNVIQPIKIVVLGLLALAFLPTLYLAGSWFAIPFVSNGLLGRELFMENYSLSNLLLTSLPLIVYGLVGLFLAIRKGTSNLSFNNDLQNNSK